MKLVPEVTVRTEYRCTDCGVLFDAWPVDGDSCCELEAAGTMLTVAEVAERLRVSESTVRNWTRDGLLKSVRLGDTLRIPLQSMPGGK